MSVARPILETSRAVWISRSLNFLGTSDTFVIGMHSGYTSSRITYAGSTDTADVFGPSIGVYGSYVKGAFSVDATFRTDFLTRIKHLGLYRNAFCGVRNKFSPCKQLFGCSGRQLSISSGECFVLEPTAGISHTRADYDSSAAAVGLSNGNSTRLLGGGRIGANFNLGQVAVN